MLIDATLLQHKRTRNKVALLRLASARGAVTGSYDRRLRYSL